MIRVRCLHRSDHLFTSSRVDLAQAPRSRQKFYSVPAGAVLRHQLATIPIIRPPKPWRLNRLPFQRLSGNSTIRFASTTPTTTTHAEIQPDYVPPPQTTTPAEGEFSSASLDEVMSSVDLPMFEHLGFLKEMGLDYGWGPTAFVETMLEHVYIYLGTPWWASIGITIVLFRAALFKFYIDAADSATRRQIVRPLEEPITARMQAAKAERNKMAMQEALMERRALYKSAGIVTWKSFVPLVQLPLGFGVFRLMRGMAALPVPGFDNGGFLWFYDLTVSDPYYLLPLITSCAYYYSFKRGGETGSSELAGQRARQLFLYVFPPVGGLIMLAWPAGLQMTMCFTALVGAAQATLFKSAMFRNLVGIHPLPKPPAPPKHPQVQAPSNNPSNPETGTGAVGLFKGALSDIMKAGEKVQSKSKGQVSHGRLTDAEMRHAATYEKRRQNEIAREKAMDRDAVLERRREQISRNREREEGLRRRAEKKATRGL